MADEPPAISTRIKVLILEDRPDDANLMVRELQKNGLDPVWERVDTPEAFLTQLEASPDIILADYHMPLLDASHCLQVLRTRGLDIPFIVVSGAIGEDVAVDMMRQGAADYVLKDRLKRLGAAVNRALHDKLHREQSRDARQALLASEKRFYSFMNNSPALAFIKDLDGKILYVNDRCEQVWNRTRAECDGKLDHELWPPEIAASLRANDLAVLRSGKTTRVTEDVRTTEGSTRRMLSFRFPFADAAGRHLLGGFSVDITEQMRTEHSLAAALAAREVLLKEVHHRVKNNLQIISSLLNMQADQLPDPKLAEIFRESQQRVQTMAMIHERLYGQENIERLDFRDYVEELTLDLFGAYGVDPERICLRLELSDVSLDLNQAIPCGLILNELLTNAIKYAFPNERRGEILIGLYLKQDTVTLRVADDGVGLPPAFDAEQWHSLGLKIVNILSRQLRATLHQEPGFGADFSLIFQRSGSPPATLRTEAMGVVAGD